ncbi:uncharacterized protein LOC133181164 [Saccostrea echinata]|uniref:uncharacterized protein LOC133181164 n=1 Tax=Saccostrea echinata TaxID=191078 RepID=UPI002A838C1D|nr:uncharacterized protein LOC133181164 [Saccostrea echinata]
MVFFKRKSQIQPSSKTNLSLSSSMGSMTQSQLNTIISDMLSLPQAGNSCEVMCRDNPITNAGKRKQLLKMLIIVLLPMGILVGMMGNVFISVVKNYYEATGIRTSLFFSVELGQMMRYLQRERDMSALYVGAIGKDTKDYLLRRYPDTDAALANMSQWPVRLANIRTEFQSKDKFLVYLNRHRYQLDQQNRTSKQEMEFYTSVIEIFMSWLYEIVSESRTGAVWKTLVAYQEIIVASEYIGRERGMGITYFARGGFETKEDYLLFLEAQINSNITFQSCKRYSELAYQIYEDQLKTKATLLAPITNMRLMIRSNKSAKRNPSLETANYWFENMTYYQETVRETQKKLAEKIDSQLSLREEEDLEVIISISCIFGVVMVICPLVILGVFKLTVQIQSYSLSIANRTKALNKEKKRTDTLLYQMLPKSVAERLKNNEIIEAEHYSEATIFFSDIVGFTKIAASSSPYQVVDMLNSLYMCFDQRIELYDVYKVETIGDAYMVVSGVPRKNGQRHAAEIGIMALDLVRTVKDLEIPHVPGMTFSLRTGCHTGPVVAGVVGTKMPRYCLFGDTVNTASKMESLGMANKVHISQTTRDILFTIDGFMIEERFDEVVQVREREREV